MENSWFVLQTKPQKEALVERKLTEMHAASFLPRMQISVRAGRHMQRRIAPMFPGYLFVQIDPEHDALAIRYVPGVHDFLRGDGLPQPIPSHIVEALRDRIGSNGLFEEPPMHFEPGAHLRIEDGPLAGFEAIFEREMSGCERVAVLLSAINLPARVILPRSSIAAC